MKKLIVDLGDLQGCEADVRGKEDEKKKSSCMS